MTLNKSKGNMYSWTTHTWNPIRGKCPHGCVYCFMKGRDVGSLRLDEKALADNLGSGRTIFVGSSTDMFAHRVYAGWIRAVLKKCNAKDNTYIFQTKNPDRFSHLLPCFAEDVDFPPKTILGTTLESNRDYDLSGDVPGVWARISGLENKRLERFKKMVSIEPIMAFDFDDFLGGLKQINPEFVSIGADSKGHNLPEPQIGDVDALILELRKFTEVKLKNNLGRIHTFKWK